MFIELTDILRCPEPHDEAYLVLIPDEMVERSVRRGRLGCPVCQREYSITEGVADFRGTFPAPMTAEVAVEPEALAAFLGLGGPGGYVGIVGGDTALAGKLIGSIPSVHFVLINPPTEAAELPMLSLLRANSIPIKSRSLRGVLLLSPYAEKGAWRQESERVVLPGLRIVGQGDPPQDPGLEVLASAGDWWVAHQSAGAGSA